MFTVYGDIVGGDQQVHTVWTRAEAKRWADDGYVVKDKMGYRVL